MRLHKKYKMGKTCNMHRDIINANELVAGSPWGKGPHKIYRHKWENKKMKWNLENSDV
jgi:hypothetical protein